MVNNFYIKPSIIADVTKLVDNLRQADIDEITAQGHNPLISLFDGFFFSDECYTCFFNNKVMGMFGIDIKFNSIWFLGSDDSEKVAREWIKEGRYYINHFLELSPILTNTVSTKNKLHIGWLKRMGAKFSAPYLINNHYFQDFYIIKGD